MIEESRFRLQFAVFLHCSHRSGCAQDTLRPTQSMLSPAQERSHSAQVRVTPCSAWQLETEGQKVVDDPVYRCIESCRFRGLRRCLAA